MRTDHFKYIIRAWHNDAVNGTHQSILCSAATLKGVMSQFSRLCALPERYRSFKDTARVQLVSPEGVSELAIIKGA